MANNRNNRGRRPQNNNKPKDNPKGVEGTPVPSQHETVLVEDAANIFFSNLVGTNVSIVENIKTYLPGMITFTAIPNFKNRSDMVNTAALSIYTYVRHANSGRANYESSDLMLYLIQIADLLGNISHIIRAYGLHNFFSTRNLYSGRILDALRVDSADLRSNAADYRWRINNVLHKLKAFAIPKTFSYFEEVMSEFSSIYRDEDSETSQFYGLIPYGIASFDATSEGGGSLVWERFADNASKPLSFYLDKVEESLDVIRNNEDMNIISGDILKAYGDNLFDISFIDNEFRLEPIYDPLKLIQFQNAHVVPGTVTLYPLKQENNKLTQVPMISSFTDKQSGLLYAGNRYINTFTDTVNANLVYLMTKYQIVMRIPEDEVGTVALDSGNIMVLNDMKVHYFIDDYLYPQQVIQNPKTNNFSNISIITKFNMHPFVYGSSLNSLPVGDMHNIAVISAQDTHRLNDTRFVLAFQTPQMSK